MFEILVTEKLHFNVVFRKSTVPVPGFVVKFKRRQSPTQSQIRMISRIISLLV